MWTPEEFIGEYKGAITAAAYRFRKAAEYDDLYQEGMIALWLCSPDTIHQVYYLRLRETNEDVKLVSRIIYNRMKDWVRYTKRLRHNHSVDYEEILNGIREGDSGESAEELL
jgi:DNA-directed RNA polymerase specialized sigma24 family protein